MRCKAQTELLKSESKLEMSSVCATQAVSPTPSAVTMGQSTNEEALGQANMWCPLLEMMYHHNIRQYMATCLCQGSKCAVPQACHFAVFVNPVEREWTDRFFQILRRTARAGPRCASEQGGLRRSFTKLFSRTTPQESCGTD